MLLRDALGTLGPIKGEKKMKRFFVFASVILGIVILDQVTKDYLVYLITGGVPMTADALDLVPVSYLMAHVTNFFNIVFTWNSGTAFSILRGVGEYAPMFIIVGTGAVVGFLGHYVMRCACRFEQWPIALIIGGALGNLIDRVRFGAVIDFLDFHIGGWHWPAFNVADMFIVCGVGLYLINWYMNKRQCIRQR